MIYIVTIFMVTMQGGSSFHNINNEVKKNTYGYCVSFEIFIITFRVNIIDVSDDKY